MPDNRSSAVRSYNSTLRAEQAANTRQRILDAAAACFARSGYAGTSLADIAAEAGVSVETVKLSGPKRALLLAAFEQAFAGSEGPQTIAERDVGRGILQLEDDQVVAGFVHFVAEANRRTSGLWAGFLSAASSDALVRQELDDLLLRRRADFLAAVAEFERRGLIGPVLDDGSRRELADILSFVASPESHEQLVTQSGWSMERYEAWLRDAVARLVLDGWGSPGGE
ncbi:TetR/AcrR family transcriptional regulator [Herbiconiux sp. CPCC 205763]|uniref:TetR/AcrR family transcriptional regulator n=1 Tax=Herbiconiux aconitum TaxID=2970913 RepID=A0ABT2GQU8_9MICO|nr:TetR/AcrR family transcriptional regulator [Herbiconiux aconitum]MCS5717947.1 TetR/AcrR family transcriptional regulator [Herbiconiux aconitum]